MRLYNRNMCGSCCQSRRGYFVERRNLQGCFLQLPGGEHIILETEFLECSENCVKCGMIKDAGDDPDITNGLLICAAVEKTEGETILIDGGMGVGRVTKPGLDQPVGAAAINSVPRKMIHEAVEDVRRQYAWEKETEGHCFYSKWEGKGRKNTESDAWHCRGAFCAWNNRYC